MYIDETVFVIKYFDSDIALFLITWLSKDIPDSSIIINESQIFLKIRVRRQYGGVRMNTSESP